ncbi:hypothetical protein ACFQ45_17545 [Rhodanobacter aciditrophus]|uniref:Uncharacterized protein n=1 Tax=Rhodanobacter aciditrophus TaxID=1623218 RepID=A0ABW4B6Q8_9GAMM
MKNEQLRELMEERTKAQWELVESIKTMNGVNPMSLMMNPKGLGGVFEALTKSAELNDQVITELARRALAHG